MKSFSYIVDECLERLNYAFSKEEASILIELAKAVAEYEKAKAIKELAEAVKSCQK